MEWMQAIGALRQEPVRPVYALVGPEPFLVRRFLRALANRLADGEQLPPIERHRFEDEGCQEAVAACQTLSLFGETSIVVLEQVTALTTANRVKHDLAPLEAYLANPVANRVFVITVDAEKLDERKRAVKLLKSQHVVVDCKPPKDAVAQRLLADMAEERGLSVESAAMAELWRRCRSLTACEQELAKLEAYADGRPIELAMVRELVVEPTEDNVFRWVEGVIKGDARGSFRVLKEMRIGGSEPLPLLAMIARQLRLLGFVHVLRRQGLSEQAMAARLGAHPFAVKMAARLAGTVSLDQVEYLLTVIADAEYDIKSGRADPELALDWVVMACLASKGRASWAR
jgi:DNA polymerase-3 subunit delta